MKKFDVEFTYTSEGVITVEAATPAEAQKKVEKLLEGGMPHTDVYYTDCRGNVDVVSDAEEENASEN